MGIAAFAGPSGGFSWRARRGWGGDGRDGLSTGRKDHVCSPSEHNARGERSQRDPNLLRAGPRSMKLGVAHALFASAWVTAWVPECEGREQGPCPTGY